MSRTKIIILRMKTLLYTAVFAGAAILLLILLFVLFSSSAGKSDSAVTTTAGEQAYEAGVYTKQIQLGDASVNIQLSLDKNHVKAVELVNLEESVSTLYPLMEPSVEEISAQLAAGKSPEEIVISEDSQYTQTIIIDTVSEMLSEHEKE